MPVLEFLVADHSTVKFFQHHFLIKNIQEPWPLFYLKKTAVKVGEETTK